MSFVIDVDDTTFMAEVMERSKHQPVLVDFWADWCEPCKQLGPVLEKLAEEYDGAFVLAKVDTERSPQVAAAVRIQSIPLVMLFIDGRPAGEFTGVRPEAQVREFLNQHLPSDADRLAEAGAEAGAEAAGGEDTEATLRKALEADPKQPAAHLGLARILARRGDLDEAKAHLDAITVNSPESRPAERLIEALDFWALAVEGATLDAPADGAANEAIDTRLIEAARRARDGEYEGALAVLYEALGEDRSYRDGLARLAMVALFGYLGEASDVTRTWQRRMANLLY